MQLTEARRDRERTFPKPFDRMAHRAMEADEAVALLDMDIAGKGRGPRKDDEQGDREEQVSERHKF